MVVAWRGLGRKDGGGFRRKQRVGSVPARLTPSGFATVYATRLASSALGNHARTHLTSPLLVSPPLIFLHLLGAVAAIFTIGRVDVRLRALVVP